MKSIVNQVEVEQMQLTLRRSVLIQYEAKKYFGKGLEQRRWSRSPNLEPFCHKSLKKF